jgi:hypothetical protein
VCVFIQRAAAGRNDGRYSGSLHETIASIVHRLFFSLSSWSGGGGQKTINTISYRRYIDLVLSVSKRAGRPPRLPRSSIYVTAAANTTSCWKSEKYSPPPPTHQKIRYLESQKRRASFPLKVNQATADH